MASKEIQLSDLQIEAESPSFWDSPDSAQKVMKRISSLKDEVDDWRMITQRIKDAIELAQIGDESLYSEIENETIALENSVEHREITAMLAGKYDRGDAIIAIHSGAGGIDAQDWAEMLLRMYLRWAEHAGYATEVLDTSEGDEAGIKSVVVSISGKYAYGYLRAEKGVHRLVRLSPYDAAHRRHTSFALVEVLPQVKETDEIIIGPDDLRIDVYRSSGAGGQNVQKNATAVRILHIPTGIVVTCQNERSQTQNRENALRVLRARLIELKDQQHVETLAELRGEYTKAEWGSQIRSYVLHPYQMVKDHRTDYEVGNALGVLNGDIDPFIEAYLRANVGTAS